jgi:hypothetical protein
MILMVVLEVGAATFTPTTTIAILHSLADSESRLYFGTNGCINIRLMVLSYGSSHSIQRREDRIQMLSMTRRRQHFLWHFFESRERRWI